MRACACVWRGTDTGTCTGTGTHTKEWQRPRAHPRANTEEVLMRQEVDVGVQGRTIEYITRRFRVHGSRHPGRRREADEHGPRTADGRMVGRVGTAGSAAVSRDSGSRQWRRDRCAPHARARLAQNCGAAVAPQTHRCPCRIFARGVVGQGGVVLVTHLQHFWHRGWCVAAARPRGRVPKTTPHRVRAAAAARRGAGSRRRWA